MAYRSSQAENPENAPASGRFSFFRAFFEVTGRSIYNIAVFVQGLAATIHEMYQMMTIWYNTSSAEKATQAQLLQAYDASYTLEKDNAAGRVLKLSQVG